MALETSNPTSYLPLPNKLLSQLADLARVRQEQRKRFSDFIVNALKDLHVISERHHDQEAVSAAVKAARKLQLKIAGLHPKDREWLVDQSFEDEIHRFLEITDDYRRFYRPRRREIRPDQKRGRGRPKGEPSNLRLRHRSGHLGLG